MSSFNISTRYANALMEFADEKKSLEQVSDDMIMLEDTLSKSKELKVVLKSPVINKDKKESIIKEIFAEKIDSLTLDFILFVNKKNRENLLFDISKRYNEIRNIKLNRVEAEVISSIEFSDNQKIVLQQQLKELSSKEVIPSFKTDDSLIGGFTVKINDTVIDASVKQQLKKLRKSLV
ncbi:MAG: ATP synthase F1 subunit delta [Melioribacteraceae bacterium]|nr:ATP synthase F1 subunit delta [Melioribacteraceae bacterium]